MEPARRQRPASRAFENRDRVAKVWRLSDRRHIRCFEIGWAFDRGHYESRLQRRKRADLFALWTLGLSAGWLRGIRRMGAIRGADVVARSVGVSRPLPGLYGGL